jgi:hypothetical protein
MGQLLINQLITLICKAGGRSLIQDLIYDTDQDGNEKNWTEDELKMPLPIYKTLTGISEKVTLLYN